MDLLTLPESAAEALRSRFGRGTEKPRISYFCGPGDVAGTYRYWREGKQDPRVPTIAYSAMFYELIERLDAQAQVITSACPDLDDGSSIRFTAVERKPWTNRKDYLLSEKALVRDVAAHVARFDPHVVVASTDFPSSGWNRIADSRRLVVTAHNTFWPMGQKPSGLIGKAKLRRLSSQARRIDAAVCISPECSRQIEDLTAGRVRGPVAIPQIVNRYATTPHDRARKLLFLGRIEAHKGVFMLLDAFLSLKTDHEEIELVFAGDGSEGEQLRARITASGEQDVRFLGRLNSEEVHHQIEQADLIVCPTTSGFNEGLATVGLEAAAHGVPTLMSSVVPAHEVLGAGCAVFKADDTEALKQSLDRLISDKAAYAALVERLEPVRDALYDRSRSWGTQLGRVLLSL